jgi:hypothetical protein
VCRWPGDEALAAHQVRTARSVAGIDPTNVEKKREDLADPRVSTP